MPGSLDLVFMDIGGVLYDDRVYARAWDSALREAGASFTDEEFAAEYAACRATQDGSFRRKLATRFLGPDAELDVLEKLAARHWNYPATALYPDALPCLQILRDAGYRLGIIANQPSQVHGAMARDGLASFFEIWGISDDLGLQKPDPELFRHAIATAAVDAARTVMVGDRLDYDMEPAKLAGMRTVWVLRGEAPDEPTPEQLGVPDATARDLAELPTVLRRVAGA
jgi:putative hydrolase of the HAD superfamily